MILLQRLFRRRNPGGSYLPLLSGNLVSVVGESKYQSAIDKTRRRAAIEPPLPVVEWPDEIAHEERLPWFVAYLEREPDNEYDSNAVRVLSEHGCVGYLSKDRASSYHAALTLAEEMGHRGGMCSAFMRQADNGMWGVVLALSGGRACADMIKAERSFRVE